MKGHGLTRKDTAGHEETRSEGEFMLKSHVYRTRKDTKRHEKTRLVDRRVLTQRVDNKGDTGKTSLFCKFSGSPIDIYIKNIKNKGSGFLTRTGKALENKLHKTNGTAEHQSLIQSLRTARQSK
jgi:hypothetical protein